MTDIYDGPVAFVDGVHYPATVVETVEGEDDRLHADLSRPLLWVADDPHPESTAEPSGESHPGGGYYRPMTEDELSHEELYHVNHVELDFGSETIEIGPEDAQAVRDFLAQRKGEV